MTDTRAASELRSHWHPSALQASTLKSARPASTRGVAGGMLNILVGATLFTLVLGMAGTERHYTIADDGHVRQVMSRSAQVSDILRDAGVTLHPADLVSPSMTASISDESVIHITRALSVTVVENGRAQVFWVRASTVGGALAFADYRLGPADAVTPGATTSLAPGLHITIARAVEIVIDDGGFQSTIVTAAPTLGQALDQAGVILGPADHVTPPPGTAPAAGMYVTIVRAPAVTLLVDGHRDELYALNGTVATLLQRAHVTLGSLDLIEPPLRTPLRAGGVVVVVRVRQEMHATYQSIAPAVVQQNDGSINMGTQKTVPGQAGSEAFYSRLVYHDSVLYSSTLLSTKEVRRPTNTVILIGTKPVPGWVMTPSGPMHYAQTMYVLATWYDSTSAGDIPGSPGFGRTAVGMTVQKGVIAVDPSVIPLYSHIYVPGYGVGVAGDTGVFGHHIDLAFADWQPKTWYTQWLTVYIID